MFNALENIIRFENGEMTEDEVVEFFQEIIDSEIVWQLQGSYGRLACQFIEQGLCTPCG